MSVATTLPDETADLLRKGWKVLVEQLGLPQATQFVVLLERGKGDAVAEIKEYWGDASIDDIHARILQWKNRAATPPLPAAD